jgi:hypothetical protein
MKQMEKFKINSWSDYWSIFDKLINLLEAENKDNIVLDLKDAKKYLNGLTDGWYEFKIAMEKTMNSNRQLMSAEQIQIAEFLSTTLDKSLSNR